MRLVRTTGQHRRRPSTDDDPGQYFGPGRRATPPPMQQVIQIPTLPAFFNMSMPLLPSVPRIARRASAATSPLTHGELTADWSFPSVTFESQHPFIKPES